MLDLKCAAFGRASKVSLGGWNSEKSKEGFSRWLGQLKQNWSLLHHDWFHFKSVGAVRPRGLTFTLWGCYRLCFWYKPTELTHSFLFCSCVCFCLYGPFNSISFHEFFRQFCFLTRFFRSYVCFLGLFNHTCLYESLLHPWFNLCGWLGLKHQLPN